MPVVTITSDFSEQDLYLSALKGKLLTNVPEVTIVDMATNIPNNSILHAAFLLRYGYRNFPEGSIHAVVVNQTKPLDKFLLVEYDGHYFLSPDNGLISMITDGSQTVYAVEASLPDRFKPYPALFFVPELAKLITSGNSPELIGTPVTDYKRMMKLSPSVTPDGIQGHVLYVDTYGNLILNIDRELFDSVCRGRNFILRMRIPGFTVKKIHHHYSEVREGDIVLITNHLGLLEIAINNGKANQLLGMEITNSIQILFE